MSTVTVDLPIEIRTRLERIAGETGVSVSDLLIDAAKKMSQANTLAELKEMAIRRETLPGFERVLAAVPELPVFHPDDVID